MRQSRRRFFLRAWGGLNSPSSVRKFGIESSLSKNCSLRIDGKKSLQALKAIPTRRRLLITCDAVERDLDNLYWMMDLINPGLFKTHEIFRRDFQLPIQKGKRRQANPKDVELAKKQANILNEVLNRVVLRGTAGSLLG